MKKPNPVPEPILPSHLNYQIDHLHEGNTFPADLQLIAEFVGVPRNKASRVKYITHARIFHKEDKQKFPYSVGWSFCSEMDTVNKRKGIITAVHRAVRKMFPNFYKDRRNLHKQYKLNQLPFNEDFADLI